MTGKIPWCSIAAIMCLLASLPLARLGAEVFPQKEDYTGFGGVGVAITCMLVVFGTGVLLSILGFWRGETPRFLPLLTALLNGAAAATPVLMFAF